MTKEEFVIQYVLNRANTVVGGFDGKGAAQTAIEVWKKIQIELHDDRTRHHPKA